MKRPVGVLPGKAGQTSNFFLRKTQRQIRNAEELRIEPPSLHPRSAILTCIESVSRVRTHGKFNGSIRKFLKTLGVTAQREIEKAVRQALAEGKLKGTEKFPARATITLGGIGFTHAIEGEIELE